MEVIIRPTAESAARLQGKDYYRWLFANEPEWTKYRENKKL